MCWLCDIYWEENKGFTFFCFDARRFTFHFSFTQCHTHINRHAHTFLEGLHPGWHYNIFFVYVCRVYLTIARAHKLTQRGHKNQSGSGLNLILLPSYGLDSGLVWLLGQGLCKLTSETGVRAKRRSDPWCSGHRCGARMNTLNVLVEIFVCHINFGWRWWSRPHENYRNHHTLQTALRFTRKQKLSLKVKSAMGKTEQKLLFFFILAHRNSNQRSVMLHCLKQD